MDHHRVPLPLRRRPASGGRALSLLISSVVAATLCLAPFGAGGTFASSASATGVGGAPSVPGPGARPATTAVAAPTVAQLIGQKVMVAMAGTTPDADLLGRVGRGEVGAVIVFGFNITSAAALRSLAATLQAAAAAGGQPPLLIATDQEGGSVRRVPWAPPTLSPPAMGSLGSASTAAAQGKATGHALRCAGINANLAPVADVPSSMASFMYQQGRTWSFDAPLTATLSDAFASGLEAGGVVATMKHFPGIGRATSNTDSSVVTITASQAVLAPGLLPYQRAIADGVPLVMLSNATYPAYDAANGAGWSRAIGVDLLRNTLGFKGVTITDSLDGTAAARGISVSSLALRAAEAGTDMIMLTGSEDSSKATFASLLLAAENGTLPVATLRASYERILGLKATLAGPVADTTAPSVRAPVSRLAAPATLGSTTVPVRTSWSASDPCGVSALTLARTANGGSWAVQRVANPTTSIGQSLTAGSTYRYRVRATDGAGITGGWAYGSTVEPLVRQSSSVVRFSGTWRTATATGYSGGSTRYATTAGASASYTFTGSAVAWVTARGPTRGSAKIYVDGAYKATVSLYSSTTVMRRMAYAASWTSQGTHTIRIVVVGSAGHPRVDVDAFVRLYRP